MKNNPNGFDLGVLHASLPKKLCTADKLIQIAPIVLIEDLQRLLKKYHDYNHNKDTFLLIGRRHLRSNNSWLHNTKRLQGGSNHCDLLINDQDAARLNLYDKSSVKITSRVGALVVEIKISQDIMQGVVSLPHG